MRSGKTDTAIAALRGEVLDDLRETSDEQLREEALADGDDLDVVADRVRSTLREAVASALREQSRRTSSFGRASRARRVPWMQGGVAVALVILGTMAYWMMPHNVRHAPETYAASTGEPRTVVLSDGSTAILNAHTWLQWVGTNGERRVQFGSGEALFDVVQDRSRPFRVGIEGSEIRVLGTQFDVYRKSNGTVVVTVLEGTVAIQGSSAKASSWTRTLTRNEQIRYSRSKLLVDVHPTEANDSVAWRHGIVAMQSGSLSDLIEELNRYSARPILLAPDARLKDLRMAAAFKIANIDETLKSLERLFPGLRVSRTPDGPIVLGMPRDPQPPTSIGDTE